MRTQRFLLTSVILGVTAIVATVVQAGGEKALDGFDRHVNKDGSFRFDASNALDDLVHIGSWFVPEGDAAGFHGVYTQKETLDAYQRTGEFPDGALLIKELRGHMRANYTTGTDVASATGIGQWFVMVKDSKGRFPKNKLWGDGWGWALFKADAPGVNAASDYKADCLGCHAPAASNDWIYVQGYPSLER